MNIHTKINTKGLEEWYNTPEQWLCNMTDKKYYKRGMKADNNYPLMFISLDIDLKHAINKTEMAGKYQCPDCSHDYGKPVFHYNHNYYQEYVNKFNENTKIKFNELKKDNQF